jgi:phosphatidylglycerophosphatase A
MGGTRHDRIILIEKFKGAGLSGKTALIFSSWFGSGLVPLIPGTFGTLTALPIAAVVNYAGVIYASLSIMAILSLSVWASHVSHVIMEKDDPSVVVIDEAAGIIIAMFLLPVSWLTVVSAFTLFRLFDIIKPFPISFIDRKVRGGIGIVLDDVVAGIFANVCVRIILVIVG